MQESTNTFRAAAIQLNSSADRAANLAAAERLVAQAAKMGATFVSLPELFPRLGSFTEILEAAESVPGPTSQLLSTWAAQLGVMLCGGSICEAIADSKRAYNTSLLFDKDGTLLAKYRKVHLFEVDIPGEVEISEGRFFLAGDALCCTSTSVGVIGQAICYDLRFPELFRQLTIDHEAELIVMPSAFTQVTGKSHWHPLIRARAIENQVFMIAPNQAGRHNHQLTSYGHSMIVDPWGNVLAEAGGDSEEVIVASIDMASLTHFRHILPSLKCVRLR